MFMGKWGILSILTHSSMVESTTDNRVIMVQIHVGQIGWWCNGNMVVSKTTVWGSIPHLPVSTGLPCGLIRLLLVEWSFILLSNGGGRSLIGSRVPLGVAQFGRVLRLGRRSCQFKSDHRDCGVEQSG